MPPRPDPAHGRIARALDVMNVFFADIRDGLAPYLAIYLVSARGPTQGRDEATPGMVMTIAGIAGLLATTPAGALVDRVKAKRAFLAVAALLVTLASFSLPIVSGFFAVAAIQWVDGDAIVHDVARGCEGAPDESCAPAPSLVRTLTTNPALAIFAGRRSCSTRQRRDAAGRRTVAGP